MAEKLQKGNIAREFSAGGVVFKRTKGLKSKRERVLWLIIKPSGSNRWQFPKGNVSKNESSKEAATREVQEEGGVTAKIVNKIGNTQYFFVLNSQKIYKNVTFYLMEYLSNTRLGHDEEVDEVKFVPFDKAYTNLTFKDDKKILEEANRLLKAGTQTSLI